MKRSQTSIMNNVCAKIQVNTWLLSLLTVIKTSNKIPTLSKRGCSAALLVAIPTVLQFRKSILEGDFHVSFRWFLLWINLIENCDRNWKNDSTIIVKHINDSDEQPKSILSLYPRYGNFNIGIHWLPNCSKFWASEIEKYPNFWRPNFSVKMF